MRWSNFETPEGQIISIDMDELVAVINYPGDKADLCLKNGTLHTVIFMGQWKTEDQYPSSPLPDWDPEILRSEIQDLILENDRLNQRNELMETYIHAIACISSEKSKFQGLCENVSCPYYDHDRAVFGKACTLGSISLIEREAAYIDKLEEL